MTNTTAHQPQACTNPYYRPINCHTLEFFFHAHCGIHSSSIDCGSCSSLALHVQPEFFLLVFRNTNLKTYHLLPPRAKRLLFFLCDELNAVEKLLTGIGFDAVIPSNTFTLKLHPLKLPHRLTAALFSCIVDSHGARLVPLA
jgi:hypothetical protein